VEIMERQVRLAKDRIKMSQKREEERNSSGDGSVCLSRYYSLRAAVFASTHGKSETDYRYFCLCTFDQASFKNLQKAIHRMTLEYTGHLKAVACTKRPLGDSYEQKLYRRHRATFSYRCCLQLAAATKTGRLLVTAAYIYLYSDVKCRAPARVSRTSTLRH
jgi:hypothetical protein